MGWFGSTPSAPTPAATDIKFAPDLSNATVSVSDLQKQLSSAQQSAQAQAAAIAASTAAAVKGQYAGYRKWFFILFGILVLVVVGIVLYDYFAPDWMPNIFFDKKNLSSDQTPPPASTADPNPPASGSTPPSSPPVQGTRRPPKVPPPTLFSQLKSAVSGGGSSPNLIPGVHDATTSISVPGSSAPLSDVHHGGYTMQWWMFIKDWNYGYGKPKSVIRRPDRTSAGLISNPDISLHPTDNALQVSVSIYPATEGGAAKSPPAPAGHSGSTDDVFVCQVPNIPLQTWFSVGITSFGRNLDIYLDGKLVKSCFLTGVPKPAVGDIEITNGGGFSGALCTFQYSPTMLNPSGAMAFWSAGTPCINETLPDGNTATGYSVNFGLYDATGKTIQKYTF